ncbi:MAG: sulfatase [Phycisphaeraceae bacterium]|nr:MAG: sulfatase [Phycisphaeraceae bacterium]
MADIGIFFHGLHGRGFASWLVAVVATLAAFPTVTHAGTRPNVLFIFADDLGSRDLSCYGSTFYETPRIDKLASQGISYSNAYAAHPRCVPSRASLMTGMFPAALGCPGGKAWNGGLDPSYTTIGESLKAGGYATGYIGKWHLGGEGMLPSDQGFDVSIAAGEAGSPRSYFAPYDGPFPNDQKWRERNKAPIGLTAKSDDEYLTDRLTDEAIGFIERHEQEAPEQPFFLLLAHYAVHQPIDAKAEPTARYQAKLDAMGPYDGPEFLPRDGVTKARQDDAAYAAMVESVDESVGRLMSTLERLGIADDTIVILSSDHGGLSNKGADSRRDVETSNLPYRAGKGHVYEGGTHVPLIIRWPGVTRPGSESHDLTVSTDLFPTLLELTGSPIPQNQHLDGVSIAGTLRGEPLEDRPPVFWHSPRARPNSTGDHNASAVRVGDWKLIQFLDTGEVELYHLGVDPFETTNLAQADPDRAAAMLAMLDDWRARIEATPPKANGKEDPND